MTKENSRWAGQRQGRRGSDGRSGSSDDGEVTFVLNPAALANPDLAIAGSRAGAVGILNAELSTDPAWIRPALERLARYGGTSIGLKLAQAGGEFVALLREFRGVSATSWSIRLR